MTTNAKRANVWVVAIHDRTPQGFLAFDVKDVLECLGSRIHGYSWLITELDCTGEQAERLCEAVARSGGAGVVMSAEELLAASQGFVQTIDATLIGVPGGRHGPAELDGLRRVELFPETRAAIVIRVVDSSFVEVMTKDLDDVRSLKACFQDVREEDTQKYFAAPSNR
jgi:hypothetical protein